MSANRDLTPDEQTNFTRIDGEVRALSAQVDRAERVAALERLEGGELISGHRSERELEARFSVTKALDEHFQGRLTGAEAEYAQEHRSGRQGAVAMPVSLFLGETRALTTTTPAGGPGSNLVPTQQGPLIDRLRPQLAVEQLGATVLRGLVGDFDLPRLKASGAASWVAEHTDATVSDPQFDKVSMKPKTVTALYETQPPDADSRDRHRNDSSR